MGSKPLWPAIAAWLAKNTCKHSHVLGLYIDTIFKLIQDGYRPPDESFKNFVQASSAFMEKTKQQFSNQILLEEIRKSAYTSTSCETFIEDKITAIKNSALISYPSYAKIAS